MTARDAQFLDTVMKMHVTPIDTMSAELFEAEVLEDADNDAYETYMQTERPNW
jgi:hypothetical protein